MDAVLMHTGRHGKGWGLFAARDIPRAPWVRLDHMIRTAPYYYTAEIAAVFAAHGRILYGESIRANNLDHLDSRYTWQSHEGFQYGVDDDRIADDRGVWGYRANHSTIWPTHAIFVRQDGHAVLIAIRDVARGEELTINYGEDYWEGRQAPVTTRLVLEGGVVVLAADDETDEESEVLMICFLYSHVCSGVRRGA